MAIIQTKQTNIYLIYLVLQGVHLLINKVFFYIEQIKQKFQIMKYHNFWNQCCTTCIVISGNCAQSLCMIKVCLKAHFQRLEKLASSIITAKSTVKGLFIFGHVVVLTPSSMHRNRSMLEKPRVLWILTRFEKHLIQ